MKRTLVFFCMLGLLSVSAHARAQGSFQRTPLEEGTFQCRERSPQAGWSRRLMRGLHRHRGTDMTMRLPRVPSENGNKAR